MMFDMILDLFLLAGMIFAIYMLVSRKYKNESEQKIYVYGSLISLIVLIIDVFYYLV